jgi:hypothetical protein
MIGEAAWVPRDGNGKKGDSKKIPPLLWLNGFGN